MKRVIAVSDSHGDVEALRGAFLHARRAGAVDAAVFLGDGLRDFETVRSMLTAEGTLCYAVRGNNDWGASEPYEQSFALGGARFYICHGHSWHVKFGLDRLWYAARECQADIALYGHTHRADVELERGLYLVNPGAVSTASYAEILVEDSGYLRVSIQKGV